MDEVLNAAVPAASTVDKPSSFYRGGPWKLALAAARLLPLPVALALGKTASRLYGRLNAKRRQIVFENQRQQLEVLVIPKHSYQPPGVGIEFRVRLIMFGVIAELADELFAMPFVGSQERVAPE